jgi:signal transduction histidine kinase
MTMKGFMAHKRRVFWAEPVLDSSWDARAALEEYPWPLPLRVAGHITIVMSIVTMLVTLGWQTPWKLAVTLVAGILFLRGFHALSAQQCLRSSRKRVAIFLAQTALAYALLPISFAYGSEILVYVLAAELQFLLPFRRAVMGTLVLWLALVAMALITAPAFIKTDMWAFVLGSPAGFAFVATFTRSAVTELVQRHRSNRLLEELNEAHSQLKAYADQVEELTVARERNRMAREIHDTLGHYLTVINVQIETAQKLRSRDPERAESALATAKRLATDCLNEVRRSVAALRPAALDDVGLSEALGHLINDLHRSTDLTIRIETQSEGTLRPEVEVTSYRVIQEALTNVRKHARARNVWLRLQWDHEWFTATVRDDGIGSDKQTVSDGARAFGLHGMHERVVKLGGTLETHSIPGEGFCVSVRIPHPLEVVTDEVPASDDAVASVREASSV